MKSIKAKLFYLLKFPPHIIVKKVWNAFVDFTHRAQLQKKITQNDLRLSASPNINYGIFKLEWFETNNVDEKVDQFICKMYRQHRFDLLGSGWIKYGYSSASPGIENELYKHNLPIQAFDADGVWLTQVVSNVHVKQSQHLWQIILKLNADYEPIDWQKDHKSGFRWNAKLWFRAQRQLSDPNLGADIKMPWELSRLQHLPQLALFAKQHLDQSPELLTEIVCEILDFMMANPIGMGANFNCAMDIGIRSANLCLTYDLIKQLDTSNIIPTAFDDLLSKYLYHSTFHILDDIEYREGKTSNHYLGNVLGILYAGLYLEPNEKVNQFLSFGLQELRSSMQKQFFEDGSNFEGSTAYHRLSAEMMAYGALAANLATPKQLEAVQKVSTKTWKCKSPLHKGEITWIHNHDDTFWHKLEQSMWFSIHISKNDGNIPQFGDNDSGRFIKLTTAGTFQDKQELIQNYEQNSRLELLPEDDIILDENTLNQGGFVSIVAGIFDAKADVPQPLFFELEFALAKNIVGNKFNQYQKKQIAEHETTFDNFSNYQDWPHRQTQTFEIEGFQTNLKTQLKSYLYPDFQIAILKSDELFIALSGISNPNQHVSMGHVHNDKGAVEIRIGDKDIVTDPGTCLYTPIPKLRLKFRSVLAHNTIVVNNQEQNKPLPGAMGLFNMASAAHCKAMSASKTELMVEMLYNDVKHVRKVKVDGDSVVVKDWCNMEFDQRFNPLGLYSNGYGKWMKV